MSTQGGCDSKSLAIVPSRSLFSTAGPFGEGSHGRTHESCDPRVPLQMSKLESQENDVFGVKNALFGVPLGTILMGFLGHLIAPSILNPC